MASQLKLRLSWMRQWEGVSRTLKCGPWKHGPSRGGFSSPTRQLKPKGVTMSKHRNVVMLTSVEIAVQERRARREAERERAIERRAQRQLKRHFDLKAGR